MKMLSSSPIIEEKKPLLRKSCQKLKSQGITPKLVVLQVGNDPASSSYIENKKKFLFEIEAQCQVLKFPENERVDSFVSAIKKQAKSRDVHGLLIQLPLPSHLSHIPMDDLIPSIKDVDGFHRDNLCQLLRGTISPKTLIPCTPKGIITLLQHFKIPIKGKKVTIVGRSLIVGKPLALLMNHYNATVSLCHRHTSNLESYCQDCDILIVAAGKEKLIQSHHLRKDRSQVVIDVGINKNSLNKVCGDVDFEKVKDQVAAITPVPGGVGPLTVYCLAENLIQATLNQL